VILRVSAVERVLSAARIIVAAALVEKEFRKLPVFGIAGGAVERHQADLLPFVLGDVGLLAGTVRGRDGIEIAQRRVEHLPLAGDALPRYGGFQKVARDMQRARGVGDARVHRNEHLADAFFSVRVELGVGLFGQHVGGAFDELRDVEIARVIEMVKAVPDGNGAVGLNARRPEFVADLDLRQRNGGGGIVGRRIGSGNAEAQCGREAAGHQ
jgi:hypothetical protein